MTTKHCSLAKHHVPVDEFSKGKNRDGLSSWCKLCAQQYNYAHKRSQGRRCACGCGAIIRDDVEMAIHCRKGVNHGGYKNGRIKDSDGYILLSCMSDHPNSDHLGRVKEHRFVMSEALGRPLYEGENVHHINGVKDDNRLENLELWVTTQPAGQRPEDLVHWAEEILIRYKK